eukprot:scaffold3849_cov179-Amphora_coffeaeformis.AAC.27
MKHLDLSTLLLLVAVVATRLHETQAFSVSVKGGKLTPQHPSRYLPTTTTTITRTSLSATKDDQQQRRGSDKKKKKRQYTLAELSQDVVQNPAKYTFSTGTTKKKKKSTYRRTRRKVEEPQQTYMYAAQRRALEREGKLESKDSSSNKDSSLPSVREQARELGLVIPQQMCDAATGMDDPHLLEKPTIMGEIRVSDTQDSSAMAYLINKPAGWAVIGSVVKETNKGTSTQTEVSLDDDSTPFVSKREKYQERVRVVNDGKAEIFEYNLYDVFDLMTDEEIEEFLEDGGELPEGWKRTKQSSSTAADFDDDNESNASSSPSSSSLSSAEKAQKELDARTAANLRRIEARNQKRTNRASFPTRPPRPSLVTWLKDYLMDTEDRTIRGGNFWTAVAGATGVDDSGLVLLCPKTQVDQVFIEYAEYVAVVGNGGFLAPTGSMDTPKVLSQEEIKSEVVAKLRTARDDDVVQTVRYVFPERMSTCDNVVPLCQEEFEEGIRGDFAANPIDRRARRRLIHCDSMSVSSLAFDDSVEAATPALPDDIAIMAERRRGPQFEAGSFLGRAALGRNPLTNAYREINGAADGHPGWIVDRYDKWLLVQHDPAFPKGPLPSIHDGKTAGIYYLEATPDRSTMGSITRTRPLLMEGQHAPDLFPIVENGIKYMVSLDRDLSTGIFLDQRPQRAWLSQNCHEDTHILNCFAHTGAFSVAAATAGATTVSLDLSKKWLDRLPQHLDANGVAFDELHDTIYGDCFEWLARLAKRGEKYDIVILDPPSSSVGSKKKRWSVKNDIDELVELAASLVKKGGLLWTTTNSASMNPIKFGRLCKKGLEAAGIPNAKLERVQPMPVDFPVVGPQPVKNLVWRIP